MAQSHQKERDEHPGIKHPPEKFTAETDSDTLSMYNEKFGVNSLSAASRRS